MVVGHERARAGRCGLSCGRGDRTIRLAFTMRARSDAKPDATFVIALYKQLLSHGSGQVAGQGDQTMRQETLQENFDFPGMIAELNSLLRLKTTVIGMKMFARVNEMQAIPKIRRPTAVHTTDQIVSMASRLGWTV